MIRQMIIPELGPLEYQLLRILWRKNPATAREVLCEYNQRTGRELKYTTVMTLLTRMVEKGILAADRERQPFQFVPQISRDQMLGERLNDFVDFFFEGRPVELAAKLFEQSELSEESIRRLEEMLRQSRSSQEKDQEEKE